MFRLLAWSFLLFVGMALSPECQIEGCQHRAEAQQRENSTENAPPVLSDTKAPEQQGGPEQATEKPKDHDSGTLRHLWEDTLAKPEAFWAFMVAVITLALVISTIFLWLSTRRMAKIATRALTELERPFVYVDIVQAGIGMSGDGQGTYNSPLIFDCVNLGRTPADLLDLEYEIREISKDAWPDPIIPKQGDRSLPPGIVAALDRPYRTTMRTFQLLGPSTGGRVGNDINLFFIGYVRYTDIFGATYVTGFCAIYDWTGEFVLRGDSRYNYTKTEKRP